MAHGDTPSLPCEDSARPFCGAGPAIFNSSTPVADPAMPVDAVPTRRDEPAMRMAAVFIRPQELATPMCAFALPMGEPAMPRYAVLMRP